MANNSFIDIKDILEEYSEEVQQGIRDIAVELAEDAKNKLRNTTNTYKVRTGKYNKGWKVTKKSGYNFVHNIIHNKTNYQLTHLLENGHMTKNGKRTKAYKHIQPVHDDVCKTFENEVQDLIKNGGR